MSNRPERSCILTVNGGSSSLKFAVFDWQMTAENLPERLLAGRIERIGLPDARATVVGPDGQERETWPVTAPDLVGAAEVLIGWVEKHVGSRALAAVGHRVVHGGPHYYRPELVTAELV